MNFLSLFIMLIICGMSRLSCVITRYIRLLHLVNGTEINISNSVNCPVSLAVGNTENLWAWWSSVSLLAVLGYLLSWQNVQEKGIFCMLTEEGVAGMWLNNGKRFCEKESTFSCNGTRQSHFGELLAVVAAD